MNTSTLIWLLLAVQLVKSNLKVKDSSTASKFDDLVADYLAMDPPKEDLFNDATTTGKGTDLHDPLSLRVIQGGPDNPFYYQLNTSSILIFDSVENFVEHIKSINWLTNKRFRHPHLVYIPGVTLSDIVEHIKDGFLIDHVGFLVHASDGSIELATSYMFTKEKCRTNQLVTINRFKNVQIRWENKNFYPEKYKNFHGCNLTGSSESSRIKILFEDIASTINLSIWNSSSDNKDIDLIVSWGQFDNDKEFITSDTVVISDLIYVVPPGDPYNQFEKMFLPFDVGTWILIDLTFLLAIITVEVIKLCPMKVQNFVFGRNFRTPTLNIFCLFLTGSQLRVPERNFSRYILTLFTIWCLIIRTCYQSKTFEFLQADMRKSGPTSLEDMGYTEDTSNVMGFNIKYSNVTRFGGDVYEPTKYGEPMNRTKFALCYTPKELRTRPREEYVKKCLNIVADPANKAFTDIPTHELIYFLNRIGSGNPSFAILENKWRTRFFAVKFKTFCPFYQTFNHKIGFYITSGIPQRLDDLVDKIRGRGLTWKDEDMGPQVLTLDDLWIGFLIHLVCLSISTFVFFLELIPTSVKNLVKKLIMLNVLVAYFRNLFPSGSKLLQRRPAKVRRKPLKPKTKMKFIKVKPFSPPSNPRFQIDLSAKVAQKSESSNPMLDVEESLPQCPTSNASNFRMVNFQAGSSTRKVGAEEFGSFETSINDEFSPAPEVQTVECRPFTLTLIEDGRGGFIDISDLACEDDWIAAGFSPLRKTL